MRKRDTKFFHKRLQEAEKPSDKVKALEAIWDDTLDRYSGVLIRQLVEPRVWLNAEFPLDSPEDSQTEVVRKMLIKSKWPRL